MSVTEAESKSKEFIAIERFKELCAHCKEEYGDGNFFFLYGPGFLVGGASKKDLQNMPFSRMKEILEINTLNNNG